MVTTFKINSSELTPSFIEAVKQLFFNKEIEIMIRSAEKPDTKNSNYSQTLVKAVSEIESQENVVTFAIEEFEKSAKNAAQS